MASQKKVVSVLNNFVLDHKLETVDALFVFLKEKLPTLDDESLNSIKFEFKDKISSEPEAISNVKRNTPKTKQARPPTEYNKFIRETMSTLKKDNPTLKNTELMTAAAAKWAAHKESLPAPEKKTDTGATAEATDADAKPKKRAVKKDKTAATPATPTPVAV